MQFLQYTKGSDGLYHLQRLADGLYDSTTLIYDVILLRLGNMEEGTKYLDALNWETNKERADTPIDYHNHIHNQYVNPSPAFLY